MFNRILNKFKSQRTDWRYILIVIISAILVGGGILSFLKSFEKEIIFNIGVSEIKEKEKNVKTELQSTEKSEKEDCFLEAKLEEDIYLPSEEKWITVDPTSKVLQGELLRKAIIQKIIDLMIVNTQRVFKEMRNFDFSSSSLKERFCQAGIDRIKVGIEKVDVNEDGIPEYILKPSYVYFKKPLEWWSGEIDSLLLAGANWVHFYILGLEGENWKEIGDLGEGLFVNLLEKSQKGYFNLAVRSHVAAGCVGTINEFAWNGEKYEQIKSTTFNFCNKESIPKEYLKIIPKEYYEHPP